MALFLHLTHACCVPACCKCLRWHVTPTVLRGCATELIVCPFVLWCDKGKHGGILPVLWLLTTLRLGPFAPSGKLGK